MLTLELPGQGKGSLSSPPRYETQFGAVARARAINAASTSKIRRPAAVMPDVLAFATQRECG
jgi:hypothetical protein